MPPCCLSAAPACLRARASRGAQRYTHLGRPPPRRCYGAVTTDGGHHAQYQPQPPPRRRGRIRSVEAVVLVVLPPTVNPGPPQQQQQPRPPRWLASQPTTPRPPASRVCLPALLPDVGAAPPPAAARASAAVPQQRPCAPRRPEPLAAARPPQPPRGASPSRNPRRLPRARAATARPACTPPGTCQCHWPPATRPARHAARPAGSYFSITWAVQPSHRRAVPRASPATARPRPNPGPRRRRAAASRASPAACIPGTGLVGCLSARPQAETEDFASALMRVGSSDRASAPERDTNLQIIPRHWPAPRIARRPAGARSHQCQ